MLTEPQYQVLRTIAGMISHSGLRRFDGRVSRALLENGHITRYPGESGYRITKNGRECLSTHENRIRSRAPRRRKEVSKFKAPDLSQEIRTIIHAVWIDKWVHKTLKQMESDLVGFHDQNRPPESRRSAKDSYTARADVLLEYFRQKTDVLTTQGVKKFFSRWAPV